MDLIVVQAASATDDSTLVALSRALRLISTIVDLASTNKSLRADWEQRRITILTMVRDLAMVKLGEDTILFKRLA